MPSLYFDFNDWWVGYYRGTDYHYICLMPTLVLRFPNKKTREFFAEDRKLYEGR